MKRIFYIDWLRIGAIITVFFFHTSHFFDPLYWHVKNPETHQTVLIFLGFVNLWIMPLFFFLSGASAMFGIRKSFKEFSISKVKRLLVPLILGAIILIPPQRYVEALSNHKFTGTFVNFISHYFNIGIFNYHIGISIAWIGIISLHLWFLGHLFIMSMVLYPLMRFLDNKAQSVLDRIHRFTAFKGGALLMFVPIAIIRVVMKKHFPEYTGWSDFTMFSLYFLWGFIYTRHEGLKQSLISTSGIALITGSVFSSLYLLSFIYKDSFFYQLFQNNKVYTYYVFQESAGALITWSWIIYIVSVGIKYLNFESAARQPLNEAVLPFYILHQTVLLLTGYIVVQWDWSCIAKFGFIAITSLFTITVIYLIGIRPFNLMRFLFGMSPKQKK